jgi:two-component system sensor histidine kinase PilS (NtrC family)
MAEYEKIAIRIIVLRLVIVITFLVSSIGLQAALGEDLLLKPYFYFTAFVLTLEIVYLLIFALFQKFRKKELFIYLQLIGDSMTVVILLFYTGGVSSVFVFMCYFLILVAGAILRRRGAILIALINGLLYGVLCLSLYYNWARPEKVFKVPFEPPTESEAFSALMINLIGFILVALLVSAMATRAEKSKQELGDVQKNLKYYRNLNDLIVSSIAGGVIVTDLSGKVNFSTPKAREMLGVSISEGWNLSEQVQLYGGPPINFEKLKETSFDIPLSLPNEKHFLISISPLKEDETKVGFIALLKDETEMMKMREQLELKKRLISLGEMAATMSHEIKNPLGSISGAAQMLKSAKPLSNDEKELLSIIQRESVRLADVLDNFLRFSSPIIPEMVEVDIVEQTKELLKLFEKNPFVVEKNLVINFRSENEKILIKVDPNLYKQALWNLLQNARKASKESGEILVSLKIEDQWAVVEVSDKGLGMSKSEIERIKEPFKTGFSQGVGLGLSVVRRIIEQHNGKIEIESKYKEGTTVKLYFRVQGNEKKNINS